MYKLKPFEKYRSCAIQEKQNILHYSSLQHQLDENLPWRLASLGSMMGLQLRAPLKPLKHHSNMASKN